jgi:hypothetical protein
LLLNSNPISLAYEANEIMPVMRITNFQSWDLMSHEAAVTVVELTRLSRQCLLCLRKIKGGERPQAHLLGVTRGPPDDPAPCRLRKDANWPP